MIVYNNQANYKIALLYTNKAIHSNPLNADTFTKKKYFFLSNSNSRQRLTQEKKRLVGLDSKNSFSYITLTKVTVFIYGYESYLMKLRIKNMHLQIVIMHFY
ncbi:unnamed protein product [Paramecium primaurelia]|uniref:Uncharacterized protein n=1 Tax=Paramecium primaurelia TaxID=5886 RepID=A0A8S1QDJ6_PARPR|nr:unnamed protein product [Paramecium primaurelia]